MWTGIISHRKQLWAMYHNHGLKQKILPCSHPTSQSIIQMLCRQMFINQCQKQELFHKQSKKTYLTFLVAIFVPFWKFESHLETLCVIQYFWNTIYICLTCGTFFFPNICPWVLSKFLSEVLFKSTTKKGLQKNAFTLLSTCTSNENENK